MIRKLLLAPLLALLLCTNSYSQEKAKPSDLLEKNIVSLQFGLTNLNISDEFRIAEEWTIRAEASANLQIPSDYLTVSSIISVQPRYYYNIAKRANAGKNIQNNAANFIYSRLAYVPKLILFIDYSGSSKPIRTGPSIILGYGMRRNMGQHFNYELGGGVGLQYAKKEHVIMPQPNFREVNLDEPSSFQFLPNLMLRIGYTF